MSIENPKTTPKFCDLIINHNCILKCAMCDVWRDTSPGLTFEESKNFIDELRSFVPPPFEINIMGGEPFLKDWTVDLCDYVHKCGYVSIISTNGYLIDRALARRITASGLDSLAISLESLNPKTHDFLRGKPGVCEKAMNAIEYICEYKTKHTPFLTILAILMEKNLHEVVELAKWVNDHKGLCNVSFLALLRPRWDLPEDTWFKSPECKDVWPQDIAATHAVLDELISLRKAGCKINNPVSQLEAMKEYYINPFQFMIKTPYKVRDYIIDLETNGDIFLSGERLYNVREKGAPRLEDVWFSEKAEEIRKNIKKHGPGKRVCVINFLVAFPLDNEKDKADYECRCHVGLGDFYMEKEQPQKALAEYQLALGIDKNNPFAYCGIGRYHYYLLKDYKKAEEYYKLALKFKPTYVDAYVELGRSSFDREKTSRAARIFKKIIKIEPESRLGYLGLGYCCYKKRKYNEAIKLFRQSEKLGQPKAVLYLGLANCYLRLGQYKEAFKELKQAFQIDCNENDLYPVLKDFFMNVDPEKAKQDLESSDGDHGPGLHHFLIGLAHIKKNDFSEAQRQFNLIDKNPGNKAYLVGAAIVCAENGQYGKAGSTVHRILSLEPENRTAKNLLKETEKPEFCVVEVTHSCMFKCKMCNYWQTRIDHNEISIEDIRRFLAGLKKLARTPLNFSGGEPLLKKGMIGLIEHVAREGFDSSLVTNGYLLNRQIIRRLADSGLSVLALSLDSLDEKIHDFIRGVPGANKKVKESIEILSSRRGRLRNVVIQSIIMEPNLDSVVDMAHWTHKQGISISFMAIARPNMLAVDPFWYQKEELKFLWPQDCRKTEAVIDELISLKRSGYRIDNPVAQLERFKLYFSDPVRFVRETPCTLGERMIHVNHTGDIYLCCEMEPVGSIKSDDIGAVWRSEKANMIRERIKACKKNCASMVNCYREGS